MLRNLDQGESGSSAIGPAWIALAAAVLAALIAALWPTLRTWQLGHRFKRLIRRELEEIGPFPVDPEHRAEILGAYTLTRENGSWTAKLKAGVALPRSLDMPWSTYLKKRFVHEQFFSLAHIGDHRDFMLSLNPTIVYFVSQLWISFRKSDGAQWSHYLCQLAGYPRLGTQKLKDAAVLWTHIVATDDGTSRRRGR